MWYLNSIRNFLNIFDTFQQKKILNFFKNKLTKDIVLFDIGAHHGETVKFFLNKFNLKEIHCFEASPINFEILKKNLKNLDIKQDIYLNNIGAGEKKKSIFLNQTQESSSSTINTFNQNSKYLKKKLKILNIRNLDKYYKKIPIHVISIDEYVMDKKIEDIDILKIDTEGYEYDIIKGINMSNKFIKFIYFEHHYDDMIQKNYTFKDINKILINYGFKKVFKSKMYFRKSFEYIYQNTSFKETLKK